MGAAVEKNSPVILGTSEGESRYLGFSEIISLARISRQKYKIPFFLNLDHGKDINWLREALRLGYESVHFDGSNLLYQENVNNLKKVVYFAKKKRAVVEGELGAITGESTFHEEKIEIKENDLTNPQEVKKFTQETGIDNLAISIGSIHGVYKESEKIIDIKRLQDIKLETNAFLVLHGGSDIDKDQLREAINSGISKVNFNTEMRMAWRESIEKSFSKGELKPYDVLREATEAIKVVVEEKINILGSANKS